MSKNVTNKHMHRLNLYIKQVGLFFVTKCIEIVVKAVISKFYLKIENIPHIFKRDFRGFLFSL